MMHKIINGQQVELSPEEEQAILAEWANEDARRIATQYVQDRINSYPPIGEQLDMLYKDFINGTTDWVDLITSIKAAHPKPLQE